MEAPPMYPVYPDVPMKPLSSDPGSRFDTNKSRGSVNMMAQDKMFQWTECRIWINSNIVNEIMEQGGVVPPAPESKRNINVVNSFLSDPKKTKTGDLLKQRYCESLVGLQGSSYFVFGLPRVRRIVRDVNEDLQPDQQADDSTGKLSDVRDDRGENIRDTKNDIFPESRRLGEKRNDYKLGESRADKKLGESRNDYRLGESRADYKLGESRADYKLGESRADYKLGESRADYRLGESRADYKLGESRFDQLGDTRKDRLREPTNRPWESRNDRGRGAVDDRQNLRESSRPPGISRTTSGRQDDIKSNPLGQSGAYDLSNTYREDLRESRRARPEPRESADSGLYASRVAYDMKKSWKADPPLYASKVLPDRPPGGGERYDDIESWRPQIPSPRARDDYPLPRPPPPPPPPPISHAPSGRYADVIRR
ncbi:uncharacterized protein [Magallana gigas]|uniref:uncharacterized protein n=1 Tax=Magallana gigas TaxID=29159 RepID=UPI0033425069